jgi:spoIIIJ-associated protein
MGNPTPKEILDAMLGFLDIPFEIRETESADGLTMQVYTREKEWLTEHNGEILDDLQSLVNRLVQAKDPAAPRITVDVEHYREMKVDALVKKVRQLADGVRRTGRPCALDPMNSFQRRIVHNTFKDDPEVMTWSPPDDARIKRITLKRRTPTPPARTP